MAKSNIKIRKATEKDHKAIIEIASDLLGWFDHDAITRAIPNDLHFHKIIVAETNNSIVGFLTYSSHEGNVFISWLGVSKSLHHNGIGTKLIKYLEKKLFAMDIKKIKVETLSETIDYKPYEKTRAFYEKLGFTKGETRPLTSAEGEKLELTTYCKNLNQD